MKKRSLVLLLLILVGVITFLDRINISVAGATIMQDLDLSRKQWGWVLSAFILSYGLMQVPIGVLGDTKGHRKVLAGIVLWWSLFTVFTGFANGFVMLIVVRFLFGIGEAGSYPNMTGVIGKWFSRSETGKAQGAIWAASRLGGAMTPFVVIPIIAWLGWRTAFFILGGIGLVWSLVWYFFYRDQASKIKGIQTAELDSLPIAALTKEKLIIPWKTILTRKQFWLLLSMYFFYAWGSWFFFSWFPTFMELGRGFSKGELTYVIAVPFLMSMIGNMAGGVLSDKLSVKYGLRTGRRLLGAGALAVSALCMFLAGFIPGKLQVFIFLSLCFGVIDLMLPSAWAICTDIGRKFAGAVSGAMNTAGNIGGFICASVFGYVVDATGNYNMPLYVIAGMLLISSFLFFKLDPSRPLAEE